MDLDVTPSDHGSSAAAADTRHGRNLTADMLEALKDFTSHPVGQARGPNSTGLSVHTYRALERRGLVRLVHQRPTWRGTQIHLFRITDAGAVEVLKHAAAAEPPVAEGVNP